MKMKIPAEYPSILYNKQTTRRKTKMEHSTTDFYLCCFLTFCGQDIKHIRKFDKNRMEFVFENSGTLQELKRQYF